MSKSANLRRARRRVRADAPDPVERVARLTRTARTSWLGLLSYLAFVGITLMGVQDADLFLPERQTELPLIGVSVPTNLFFYIAPFLGAMLYIHMHLYLLKLWKALGELRSDASRPAGEGIAPWIVSDMALGAREGAVHDYPLRVFARWVAILSIFAAGPAVLAAFWWRSMPKHDEVLTILFCGLPLFFSILAGWESWRSLRRGGTEARYMPWRARAGWGAGLAVLCVTGFLTTEGGITDRFLRPAQLEGVVFVETPPGWLPRDEAEQAYRPTWCAAQGIAPLACGPGPLAGEEEPAYLDYQRLRWCREVIGDETMEPDCRKFFKQLAEQYATDWRKARRDALNRLPERTLSGIDLRHADLRWARMERATLRGARMEGARLWHSRMEAADLIGVSMEGAGLYQARMEGTRLDFAVMDGADLFGSRMDKNTSLTRATLRGAALRRVDYSGVSVSAEQVNSTFGDASVILPEEVPRPDHWPDWELPMFGNNDFYTEWEKWRADPEGYTPPPKPKD